jgi:hypothetical protein
MLPSTDANALLSAWRRSNARTSSPTSRHVAGGLALSRRERAAVRKAAATPDFATIRDESGEDVAGDGTHVKMLSVADIRSPAPQTRQISRGDAVQLQRAITPATGLGPAGGVHASPSRATPGRHKAADASRRRTERSTQQVTRALNEQADAKSRQTTHERRKRAAKIAGSPQRLLRSMVRSETAVAEGDRRERAFDLSTCHVDRVRDEGGSFTPRHVKAAYLRALQDADNVAKVSPQWLRRHVRPAHGMDRLPPIDGTGDIEAVTDELQRRSAAKAARRGLPPSEQFTELSDAISAVVVAAKAGRRSPEPQGLCGDTMCYWDRVNVYNRYRESLGPSSAASAAGGGGTHKQRKRPPTK